MSLPDRSPPKLSTTLLFTDLWVSIWTGLGQVILVAMATVKVAGVLVWTVDHSFAHMLGYPGRDGWEAASSQAGVLSPTVVSE